MRRSNSRLERAGSTAAAQPDRYAHRVGREGEGCNTWRREGVLAEQENSVWVGPGEVASQTHPEILTSCRGRSQVGPRSILVAAEEVSMGDQRESWSRREFVSGLTLAGTAGFDHRGSGRSRSPRRRD